MSIFINIRNRFRNIDCWNNIKKGVIPILKPILKINKKEILLSSEGKICRKK